MPRAGITIEIKPGDLEALERKLRSLEVRSQRKVLRKGTRAASTPIQKAIRNAAPVGPTGNLKRSIGRKFKFYRGSLTDIAVIGPQIKRKEGALGYHGHLVEFGTKERTIKNLWGRPGVKGSAGRMPPNPFAKRAADAVLSVAGQKGLDAIRKALDVEIKALRGGG